MGRGLRRSTAAAEMMPSSALAAAADSLEEKVRRVLIPRGAAS